MNNYSIILLPIIVALVQAMKQTAIPNKYMPFVSIVIAEILCYFYIKNMDIAQVGIFGLELGLGAVGLYSGVTNFIQSEPIPEPTPEPEPEPTPTPEVNATLTVEPEPTPEEENTLQKLEIPPVEIKQEPPIETPKEK
jgi:hypothetical protein